MQSTEASVVLRMVDIVMPIDVAAGRDVLFFLRRCRDDWLRPTLEFHSEFPSGETDGIGSLLPI